MRFGIPSCATNCPLTSNACLSPRITSAVERGSYLKISRDQVDLAAEQIHLSEKPPTSISDKCSISHNNGHYP
jgi:hypothetical protein